jgi:hypothetical protein
MDNESSPLVLSVIAATRLEVQLTPKGLGRTALPVVLGGGRQFVREIACFACATFR